MGIQGRRTFAALFAGTVGACAIGLAASAAGGLGAGMLGSARPGWVAFATALFAILTFTPPMTARLMGAANDDLAAGYAFALLCASLLLLLGMVYVSLIPLVPGVVAGASVAGIRFAEWNS